MYFHKHDRWFFFAITAKDVHTKMNLFGWGLIKIKLDTVIDLEPPELASMSLQFSLNLIWALFVPFVYFQGGVC